MSIGELPKKWIKDEIALQEKRLRELEKAQHFANITGFQSIVDMRKQFIAIAKGKLKDL